MPRYNMEFDDGQMNWDPYTQCYSCDVRAHILKSARAIGGEVVFEGVMSNGRRLLGVTVPQSDYTELPFRISIPDRVSWAVFR